MVVRDDGKIALKWVINPNGKTVKIDGTDVYYVFQPRLHVVMEWIAPQHVERLLSVRQKTCNCNNGTFKQAFEYANLLDVNLYENGDRYGKQSPNYQEVKIDS